jgi:hypothetical protein
VFAQGTGGTRYGRAGRIAEQHFARHAISRADPQKPSSIANAGKLEIESALEKRAGYLRLARMMWERLRDEMYDGRLPGYAFMLAGKINRLPNDVWRSVGLNDLYFKDLAYFVVDGNKTVAVACVLETELTAMLEGRPIAAPSPQRENERDPGGRPRQYDGEAFLIEAFRIIYEGALPRSQAELRRLALDAYNANSSIEAEKNPSDDWAKLKIRRLWHRLELGKKR